MKRYTLITLFALILSTLCAFAQDTTNVSPKIIIPSGFNLWYVAIFAAGMVIHFINHVLKTGGGWKELIGNFSAQFVGWFFNKFHLSVISGAAAATLGVVAQLGLDVPFATLNIHGIVAALVTGYLGDSAFNNGTPAVEKPVV